MSTSKIIASPVHSLYRYTKALDNIKALRKDRVADLKVDKERLESLKKEKEHSDKIKGRLEDLQSDIAAKQVEHERLRQYREDLVIANTRFIELSQKFRQMYADVEMYEEQKKSRMRDLEEAKMNTPEIPGTHDSTVRNSPIRRTFLGAQLTVADSI